MQRNVVGALLLALALGVGACGSASKPLTEAQLRTQASAVCQDVTRQVQALAARATPATMHASLARATTIMSNGVARLQALKAPPELAARYARLVAWKGAQRDAARELSRPGGRLSARSRAAVRAHDSPVWTLSHQLGIPACS